MKLGILSFDLFKIREQSTSMLSSHTLLVPDASTVLLQIPHWAKCFTVIDLTPAFFTIPRDEESQPLFAFSWKEQLLMWTRLPQGFTGSPTIFSQLLKEDLKDIELPSRSVLVQYVDDLLIASRNCNDYLKDTIHLCTALATKGHCAPPSKLQLCQKEVKYLGFI